MAANVDLTQFRAEDARSTKRVISGIYTAPVYVTNGDPFLPADVKLGQIHFLNLEPLTNGSVIILARYDYVNLKLKLFDMAGAEIANATDLTTYSGRFEAVGL
jgi:hypothetical protein